LINIDDTKNIKYKNYNIAIHLIIDDKIREKEFNIEKKYIVYNDLRPYICKPGQKKRPL